MHTNIKTLSLSVALLLMTNFGLEAQRRNEPVGSPLAASPKLVVGVVVDQMRYDYLTRFWEHYGDGGFKRLVRDGFSGRNNHFNYVPTVTGPGHASIYTGTTPSGHGIISNNWFDKESGKDIYCVSDSTFSSLGTVTDAGQMSPRRLETTTITDQLRLHTQNRGKVIAIALKDRASILPGGHAANAAYWFQGSSEGNWISSSYYMDALPAWVSQFNASREVDQYKKAWNTLGDIKTYVESGPDNNLFEGVFRGKQTPTFPYDIPMLWDANGQYDLLKTTPYGNSITTDFVIEAIEAESLGADEITDFLTISYSSTDYIGHFFGVNSKEIEDTYIRLDQEIERLLKALDKKVGEGQYTLFLTADHGAVNVPAYLQQQKIPAGYGEPLQNTRAFIDFVAFTYGDAALIRNISNNQIFLDHRLLASLDLEPREVEERLAAELLGYEGIDRVYTAYQMQHQEYNSGIAKLLQNGYNQKLSGDVLWVSSPGFANYSGTGSTHGSAYTYDTQVPLLFYGMGIKPGQTAMRTEIPDIAPTLAVLLGIAFPNGATGQPVTAALK
jgi:predicted AlkP superfamily pyrophosphatase or phosphodiesterase